MGCLYGAAVAGFNGSKFAMSLPYGSFGEGYLHSKTFMATFGRLPPFGRLTCSNLCVSLGKLSVCPSVTLCHAWLSRSAVTLAGRLPGPCLAVDGKLRLHTALSGRLTCSNLCVSLGNLSVCHALSRSAVTLGCHAGGPTATPLSGRRWQASVA